MEEKNARCLFENLEPEIQAKLRSIMREKVFRAGEQVFAQDVPAQAFYIVVSGRVKIARLAPNGCEIILCMLGPGDLFCPVSLLDGGPQLGMAQAITEITLMWAERAECCALFKTSPLLLSTLQTTCLGEVRRFVRRLELLTSRRLKERLAIILLDESLYRLASCVSNDELRITQQELAGLVGASRESVSHLLAEWEREGIVAVRRGRVIIQHRGQLDQIAGE